jgi:hypothetical protein
MRKDQVPQDSCLLEGQREICYAVDEAGHYVLTPTAGWEPKNIANLQAWEVIRDQLQETLAAIRAGRASALAFHMARNQMDVPLLAAYVGLARWRVRRHLKPAVFARLQPALLERYAAVLEIGVDELRQVPERIELPLPVEKK